MLANPPFSLKEWGHKEWKNGDKFGRDRLGCPPKSYADYAFVQHMVASLKSDGMPGVVLPHGVLFLLLPHAQKTADVGRLQPCGMLTEQLLQSRPRKSPVHSPRGYSSGSVP